MIIFAINHGSIHYTKIIVVFLSKAKVYDFCFSAFLLKICFKF